MPKVVLIDNYDSFTWNIYEYLCREGAQVEVYRNDKITVPEVEALNPDLILISPGPGNPENDSGVSREIIKHFMGKLPIFGVCMGLQCMVSVLGGVVEYAGEIVHGKTSSIVHNNTGVFENVAQGISATRYHSLAANYEKLPDCLEVTARTENSGVIQGVKHKEFILEGVQFHPESILTQEGRKMLRNFLSYRGGKWSDMNTAKVQSEAKQQSSILETIYAKRREEIAQQEQKFGERFSDLEQAISMGLAPSLIDFKQRLLSSKAQMGLIAEIKRASPSKGPIGLDIIAPEQALKYTEAGCNAISVLTEPNWFKGSILDLKLVRQAVEGVTNRPAILRKEFIFSKYQIAEARLAGADSVLLIVKMLSDFELLELYNYSMELGMVPLVEVSNSEEMQRAVKLNPDVVGVNNRNLHSFEVDMNTTTKIAELVSQQDILLVALSGISGPEQVQTYKQQGVRGILVGESLMRAADPKKFAQDLVN